MRESIHMRDYSNQVLFVLVCLLFSGEREAGRYEASWDASGFRTGVYFLRMETVDDKYVRKIVLVR